jgi:diacylglycerol O-acyltransferase
MHATPMDPSRPLWRMFVVRNYASGGGVIFTRVHHVIADGSTLLQVFLRLYDPTDTGEPPATGVRKRPRESALAQLSPARLAKRLWILAYGAPNACL